MTCNIGKMRHNKREKNLSLKLSIKLSGSNIKTMCFTKTWAKKPMPKLA
jgi:hypothetical protein